eukprot:CAMPEP_0176335434 /NCGR_PEP_ID=MMETSP0121_2-20121125/78612_1 /TAXON_ID=160619 /ORGANISM="Kryptoperidinium foliaceum, Strain CCMP 1326" /LENGTH=331 /DNA_ID=CAMNT_0017678407 /DNA_START=229 /DNA_END=1223 /DNA_ORIENTATION=-
MGQDETLGGGWRSAAAAAHLPLDGDAPDAEDASSSPSASAEPPGGGRARWSVGLRAEGAFPRHAGVTASSGCQSSSKLPLGQSAEVTAEQWHSGMANAFLPLLMEKKRDFGRRMEEERRTREEERRLPLDGDGREAEDGVVAAAAVDVGGALGGGGARGSAGLKAEGGDPRHAGVTASSFDCKSSKLRLGQSAEVMAEQWRSGMANAFLPHAASATNCSKIISWAMGWSSIASRTILKRAGSLGTTRGGFAVPRPHFVQVGRMSVVHPGDALVELDEFLLLQVSVAVEVLQGEQLEHQVLDAALQRRGVCRIKMRVAPRASAERRPTLQRR